MSYYMPTGLPELDGLLQGGISCSGITEIVGDPESALRLAAAVIRQQQTQYPYTHSIWFDGAAASGARALTPETLADFGLDPAKVLVVTPANVEEMEQVFLTANVVWAGFVITGLTSSEQAGDYLAWLQQVANLLARWPLVFLILMPPGPAAPRARARRLVSVRLRLALPVAPRQPNELIAALIKHSHAPTGRTVRFPLPT